MKTRLTSLLLGFVLCSQAQEAGTKLDEAWRVAATATDGDGQIWGIADKIAAPSGYVSASDIKRLAIFDPQTRLWQSYQAEAAADGRAMSLATLSDGTVACIWQSGEKTLLTRHRNGKSEEWAKLNKTFNAPKLLPLKDAGLVITESGPNIARIPKNAGGAKIITLEDALFLKPEKIEQGSRSYAAVRAVQAGDSSIWIWSPSLEPTRFSWRVPAFLRLDNDVIEQVQGLPFKPDAPISAIIPDGGDHLYAAEAGKGLWRVSLRGEKSKHIDEANTSLRYIEHLEFIHSVLHLVTCPQPDKVSMKMSTMVQNHMEMSLTHFYDISKPTGKLYRLVNGKIDLMLEGVDRQPGFGRLPRALIAAADGLLIGSNNGPPWWLPADGKPVLLDQSRGFRLQSATGVAAIQGNCYLVRSYDTTWMILDPSVKFELSPSAARVSHFYTDFRMVEDSRHHLWAQRLEPKGFSKWDGKTWINQTLPPVVQNLLSDNGVDQHDQAWLIDQSNQTSAVLDLKTGKWTSFSTAEKAIEQRLRAGDRIVFPRFLVFSPIAHANGTKGFVALGGKVHVLNKGKWSQSTLTEIVGPGAAAVSGEPFFNSRGQFCLPINNRHFAFLPNAKWVEIEHPDTSQDRTYVAGETKPPADCIVPNVTSMACDRHGIAWLTQADGTLWKWFAGAAVKIPADSPTPALPMNTSIDLVHVDDLGNAHLRQRGGWSKETYFAILALPRQAPPVAKLERVELGIAEITLNTQPQNWCRIRIDDGNWQAPVQNSKLTTPPMLPGKHRIEVQAMDAELTPQGPSQTLVVKVQAAAASVITDQIDGLRSPDLEKRESAARILGNQGPSALPELHRRLLSSTDETQRWWLNAVIQSINREQQK